MYNKKHSFGIIVLMAIIVLGTAGAAIVVASGWKTHTSESIPPGPTTAKTTGCTNPNGIFCDGFESGDLSAWSVPQPCQVPILNLPVPTAVVAP